MTRCTCGADEGKRRNHDPRACALVLEAMGRLPGHQPPPAPPRLQPDPPLPLRKPKSRHQAAKRTVRRGLTFRSKVEADMTEQLWLRADAEGGLVIRQPRMDLWASWAPGAEKPPTWTPDALYVCLHRDLAGGPVRMASPAEFAWQVEVHEAKTARGLESQDYKPRLAAFRAANPHVRVYVWRREGGRLASELLPPYAQLDDLEQGGPHGV